MNKVEEMIVKNNKRQLSIYCNIINKIVMDDIEYYMDKKYAQFFINHNKKNDRSNF